MPVRNARPYLDASIASILAQTHGDFELVIGDDGSTDGSSERLDHWARRDSRIRLHHSAEARGPAGSSNWVVGLARHGIVARMDADDVCGPRRLEAQLASLRANPRAVLVGTLSDFINVAGRRVRPPIRSQLRKLGSHRSPFPHGSIMFRRTAFEKAGGYRQGCDYWEDQELYWRMAEMGAILVLPQTHYSHRFNPGQARIRTDTSQVERALDMFYRCLAARESGEDYNRLLAAEDSNQAGICPTAYRALASLQLMSGRRPVLLRKLLRSQRLGLDRASLVSLAWCSAAFVWPAALRLAMRSYAYGREALLARRQFDEPLVWAPHVPGPASVEQTAEAA